MLGVFGLVPYTITYSYRIRVCDAVVNQVGLDPAAGGLPLLTILYRPSDLALPRPSGGFTRTPPPLDGITHSDDTMCYVVLL